MTFAEMLEHLPVQMRKLPKDAKGRPIPFFVDTETTPWKDGCPDFRVMCPDAMRLCILQHRCWVCGVRLAHWPACTFVAGPLSGLQRRTVEPPCHLACATWAAQACPFLASPKRGYASEGLDPADIVHPGMVKSGVTMLWTCRSYRLGVMRNGHYMFHIPDATHVSWWIYGRLATRQEVLDCIAENMPKLTEVGITVDREDFERRFLPDEHVV